MLQGYRTLGLALATAVLGVLQATDFTTILSDPKTAGLVVTCIGIATAVMRFLTKTPVGGK